VLQTIAFLAHLKFDLGVPGPHLVVAPLSVLSSWMTEIKRFCPELRAVKLHSSDVEERKRLITSLSEGDDYDVVVGAVCCKRPSWQRHSSPHRPPRESKPV
tara:strand:- start:467 stop:769 length:303 start_codon:yes stop_codon:yes gene_type:complete